MSNLAQLKLTDARKPTQVSAVVQRRNKLLKRIWQQIQLVKAQQSGSTYTAKKFRTVTNSATDQRTAIEVGVRVKPWWFVTESGQLAISVRYGTRVLELAPKKHAVVVGSEQELTAAFEVLHTATANGELDAQILAAANVLRAGFTK